MDSDSSFPRRGECITNTFVPKMPFCHPYEKSLKPIYFSYVILPMKQTTLDFCNLMVEHSLLRPGSCSPRVKLKIPRVGRLMIFMTPTTESKYQNDLLFKMGTPLAYEPKWELLPQKVFLVSFRSNKSIFKHEGHEAAFARFLPFSSPISGLWRAARGERRLRVLRN